MFLSFAVTYLLKRKQTNLSLKIKFYSMLSGATCLLWGGVGVKKNPNHQMGLG